MGKKSTSPILALAVSLLVGSAFAQDHHEGHMHHHQFPQDVDAFHSVLAPIWHAQPGKERSRNACAKANEMEKLAKDIRSGDASPLVAAVGSLKKSCRGKQGDVDTALTQVHEAFHRLIEHS